MQRRRAFAIETRQCIAVTDVNRFEAAFLNDVRAKHADILEAIRKERELSKATEEKLNNVLTAFVKSSMPPTIWGEAMAAFTVCFSVLQCFGPAATGFLADVTGSLAAGLGVSAGILLLGAVVGLLQRPI